MGEQLKIYIKEHPDFIDIEKSQFKEQLLWADKERYITLHVFGDKVFYTLYQLDTALMWVNKMDKHFD